MRPIALMLFFAAACTGVEPDEDGPNDAFLVDGKSDSAGIAEGSADAVAVLALANDSDYTTLHDQIGLAKNAARNIIAYRLGDDATANTADDARFQTLKQLDAVPYVGPTAFKKLVDWAHAHAPVAPPPANDWSASLPAGSFDLTVQVNFRSHSSYCQPSCIERNGLGDVVLRIFRGSDGVLAMSFINFSVQNFGPAAIPADGKFERSEPFSNVNGEGAVAFSGHFEPGRVVVIDDYSYDYTWEKGMFSGWTDSVVSTASGSASF